MPQAKKVADGRAIIPDVVQAALGTKTFKQACKPLSEDDRQMLSRGIGMDVNEWRKEFGQQLRETGSELLLILRKNLEGLKPGEMAYTLAVLADKAQALESRSPSTVHNTQINHYHGMTKDQLLDALDGPKSLAPLDSPPQTNVFPIGQKSASAIDPSDPQVMHDSLAGIVCGMDSQPHQTISQ